MSVKKLHFIFISLTFNFAKVPVMSLRQTTYSFRETIIQIGERQFTQNKVLIKKSTAKCVPHVLSNIYIENKNRNIYISWMFILQPSKFCL